MVVFYSNRLRISERGSSHINIVLMQSCSTLKEETYHMIIIYSLGFIVLIMFNSRSHGSAHSVHRPIFYRILLPLHLSWTDLVSCTLSLSVPTLSARAIHLQTIIRILLFISQPIERSRNKLFHVVKNCIMHWQCLLYFLSLSWSTNCHKVDSFHPSIFQV